ncbi:hypothetical protein GC105_11055 [Alkalibaculum sp. M08DMB]|uniref:Lipoprotein n=1 Tax=Alkalibaculum sporogenes TaxID=2655001 RepID=A0A6A7KAW4_9FIRM|nr:hypothetical protein [Alkalibaculum sporogenes]MPW26327.1 hypothetical protein [Alkalibaculum sporogenes]
MKIKKIYLIVIISGIMLLSSCFNEEIENKTDDIIENEQIEDYNTIFESVELENNEDYNIHRITQDGTLLEILNNKNILISKDNNNLVVYNTKNQDENIIAEEAWNATVSIDKSIISYEKEDGIYVSSINGNDSILVYSLNDEITRNFIISSDSKSILIQTIKDDEFQNKIVDLEGNVKELNITENDDFIITKLIYFRNNRLYATAQIKKDKIDVNDEELIKTTDLIRLDTNTGAVKNITNMSPQDQTYLLDIYDEDKLLIKIEETTVDDDGINVKNSIKRVNLSNGGIYSTRIDIADTTVIKILDRETEYIWLEEPIEYDIKFPNKLEIKYRNNKGVVDTIGSITSGIPSTIFVQDNDIYFNSNGDIYIIDMLNRE